MGCKIATWCSGTYVPRQRKRSLFSLHGKCSGMGHTLLKPSTPLKPFTFQAYKQLLKLLLTAMIKANLISLTAVHVYDSFHVQFLSMISPVMGLYQPT